MLLLQEFQIGDLVAPELRCDLLVDKKLINLTGLFGEKRKPLKYFFPLPRKFFWYLITVIDLLPQGCDVVGHVSRFEKLVFRLRNLKASLFFLTRKEFEQWEDQMTVKVRD